MPMNRITVQILGSETDAGHVRLSEFVEQLEAVQEALRQTERLLSGDAQTDIFYRVVDLRHHSPAAIALEPSTAIGRRPRVRPDRVVKAFTRSLGQLRTARKPPKRMDLEALESFKKLGATLVKHVQKVQIITHEPRTSTKKAEQKVIPIDRSFTERVEELIGPDTISPGSVSGFLEQINVHRTPRFTIYPTVGPTRVRCFFSRDMLSQVSKALDRFVTVSGDLRYKSWDRHPHAVDARKIDPHERDEDLPSIFDVRGVSPDATGEAKSERFVRSLRDENWP